MPILTMFAGRFCRSSEVAAEVCAATGFKHVGDTAILEAASSISGMGTDKLQRAFAAKTSVFNKFTHEKECSVAYLKLALANLVAKDNVLVTGYGGQLVPSAISHLLRIALIADLPYRLAAAEDSESLGEKEALKQIRRGDEDCAGWIDFIRHTPQECWDPALYDLFIPMHKSSVAGASALIHENALKSVVQATPASRQAVEDFHLAAEVEVRLAQEGHNVEVDAKNGAVTISIHKHVLMLSRLEEELKSLADQVSGVERVDVAVGENFHQTNIYRKHDFSMPSRVLLVDDERDLAQTLSERLQMRDMGSAVAYDGASALKLVEEDEPEVMIIDLKMPGIDGLEVLRQVKATRPEIEVIILTGHGSDADRDRCMELGAFGYLHKPVEIDKLSDMLKQAHQKIRNPGMEQ
jgi:CheY-like chemotaxis protein